MPGSGGRVGGVVAIETISLFLFRTVVTVEPSAKVVTWVVSLDVPPLPGTTLEAFGDAWLIPVMLMPNSFAKTLEAAVTVPFIWMGENG